MARDRLVRSLAAGALLLVALVVLLRALDMATLTYALPSQDPRRSIEQTAPWGPGVAASVVAGVVVAAQAAWLVWNLRRRPPTRLWWAAGGLTLLSVVVVAFVGMVPTPAF